MKQNSRPLPDGRSLSVTAAGCQTVGAVSQAANGAVRIRSSVEQGAVPRAPGLGLASSLWRRQSDFSQAACPLNRTQPLMRMGPVVEKRCVIVYAPAIRANEFTGLVGNISASRAERLIADGPTRFADVVARQI